MPGPQAEPRPAATSASVPPDCSDGEVGGDVVSLQRAKAPGPCSGRSSPVLSEEPVGPSPAPPWAARGQPLTPSLSEWCHPLPALPQPPPLSTPCQKEWWGRQHVRVARTQGQHPQRPLERVGTGPAAPTGDPGTGQRRVWGPEEPPPTRDAGQGWYVTLEMDGQVLT